VSASVLALLLATATAAAPAGGNPPAAAGVDAAHAEEAGPADEPPAGGGADVARDDEAVIPGGPAPLAPPPAPTPHPPRSWFFFPAFYYLPETGAGFGLAGGRDFRLDESTRTSTALLVAAASIEGQGSVDGSADVWLRGGSLLALRARAVNYPDRFYGVGPHAPSAYEEFTRRFAEGSVSAELATLSGRLRAGPRVSARAEEIVDLVPGGRLASSGLERLHGWSGLGVGGSVTWDTRDHPLWPLHGAFAQAYYLRYLDGVGRNDGFGKGAVDLRAFEPIGGDRVLAVNAVLETTDGQTPFSLLSKLGNARFMRGYREGRYRDAMVWATQVELRAPIQGPFSATVFGGAGNVFPRFSELTLRDPKLAAGVGARYRLTPGGANLRVDASIGSSGPEIYVLLLEAF
jgi:hypothetical protein